MPKSITIQVPPQYTQSTALLKSALAEAAGIESGQISGYNILKESIDARHRQPMIQLKAEVFIDELFTPPTPFSFKWKKVNHSQNQVIIVGTGPAGLFAALRLIEMGIKPVMIERGKDVRARRRDLALLNKEGILNQESNYCFGEGGAGTYSDGKLYTRSKKRGDVQRILELFCHFGADPGILYKAHPHIGTNHLPQIITAMREHIRSCGGEIHFETKLTDIIIRNNQWYTIETNRKDSIKGDALILATGHSARDVFQLLHNRNILIEAKAFALGVRIEHPQSLIDAVQYHCNPRDPHLPPASYSLVEQIQGKGVFSFCMCPGGIIAPASTSPGELVVNGWSPSKRNNPFANSGMVVTVEQQDVLKWLHKIKSTAMAPDESSPLLLMKFQQQVEQVAYRAGGGHFQAPAQRMVDFFNRKPSNDLPANSYLPGLNSVQLQEVLPGFIEERLRLAFQTFGKKMNGYFTNEAVVVATESRTSSPVRIPRDPKSLQHPQISGLYPCGEGAGYAGGIVSAAMDGERTANAVATTLGIEVKNL